MANERKIEIEMFTLLRGLWDYFFRKDEYYIVILGLDNAGKTVSPVRNFPGVYRILQTLLEKTKNLFIRNYNGIPMDKITSTVGLNGMSSRDAMGVLYCVCVCCSGED